MSVPYRDWKHVADIRVQNPSSQDGFQAKVTIPWRPGMAGDFRDIRFASVTGRKLPYWIEAQTDFLSATVWIALPAWDRKIRMYYGNGTAESESDGDSVFELFDDFNDGVIDTNKWTIETRGNSSITEENGYIELRTSGTSSARVYLYSQPNILPDTSIVIEGSAKVYSNNDYKSNAMATIRLYNSDKSAEALGLLSLRDGVISVRAGSNDNSNTVTFTQDHAQWNNLRLISEPTQTTYEYGNQSVSVDESSDWTQESDSFALYNSFIDGESGTNWTRWDWIIVRRYADIVPSLSIIRTRPNPYYYPYVPESTFDMISSSVTTNVSANVLIDRIEDTDTTQISGSLDGIIDKIPFPSIVDVVSANKFVDKVGGEEICQVSTRINSMKAFADLDNFNVEKISVSKSINDAMWQLTATIDGELSPAEFRHLNFSRADAEGVTRHLFTGIIPDTRYTLQIAQNKINVTAFDYGWYLSAQYVPSDMLVMNLDGDYSSWDEWISALLDETGIIPYKLTTCTEVPSKEFVFNEKTTKQDAINEIAEATGFIFSVQWVQVGNTYEPAAYFIDPDYVDDSINGLDLPADTTISWPDKSLIDIPTLQSPTDEKINRVKVRGCDSNGNWYSATVESSEVSNGEMYPREYYYESGDLDTQTKVNAKAASLFAYFTSDSYIVEATFIKRFDLKLFQKIRFTGSGFPSKLTELGWLRIISITYSAENVNDLVTIKAVVNRDVRLLLSEVNTYLGDSLSNEELIIDSKLDSLNITPMIGTVQSIDGNIATILTEDGKTIKARIIIDS